MNRYANAGDGLKKMFIAQIGAIVCSVLALIPIINIIAAIGAIVFAVLSIWGLYTAGRDIEGCKTAFIVTIISLVISVISTFTSGSAFLAVVFDIADSICAFLVIYYVCTSVGEALKESGAADVAGKGETIWKINLVCYAASIVISILSVIPFINIIAGICAIVIAIVSIVAGVLYMIFLYKSYQVFGA